MITFSQPLIYSYCIQYLRSVIVIVLGGPSSSSSWCCWCWWSRRHPQVDALSMPNNTEVDGMSHGDDMGTAYLGVGGAKHDVWGGWLWKPCRHDEWAQRCPKRRNKCRYDCKCTENHQNAPKEIKTARLTFWNHKPALIQVKRLWKLERLEHTVCMDMWSIMKNARTPADETGNIRTCWNESNMPNSPYRLVRGHPEHWTYGRMHTAMGMTWKQLDAALFDPYIHAASQYFPEYWQ